MMTEPAIFKLFSDLWASLGTLPTTVPILTEPA